MRRKIISCGLGILPGLFLALNAAHAESSGKLESVKISSQIISVDGDEGRFREDNYVTDDFSGGLKELLLSGNINEALLYLDAWALYDGDYGMNLDLSKEDSYYFTLNNRLTRRYYDGSNEPWSPARYSLGNEAADRLDEDIFTDRLNTDAELGLKLDNFPDITFGYTRWSRRGKVTLLRGEDVVQSGFPALRSFPMLANVDGISDKVFVKISDQIADKHNVSLKQEIEIYHDNQVIDSARYTSGVLKEQRLYIDEPQFRDSLTHFNYNSFLTEKTYLSTNYLFQHLKNTTQRTELRPVNNFVSSSGNTLNQFIHPETDNQRKANILNLGLVNMDSLVKDLQVGLNFRFQNADTDSEGRGLRSGTWRAAESNQQEFQYGESLSVNYTGFQRTSLTYTLETEQRKLNWKELIDIAAYELRSNFGASETIIDRETDIKHNDIINTLQLSTRFNKKSRLTAKYKHADKKRDYENVVDNLPAFYPGYLGSSDQNIDQFTLGFNSSITNTWSGGLQYIFEANEIGYSRQGGKNGGESVRNALSGSLMGLVTDKLTMTFMMMGELGEIDTPGSGASTNPTFAQGEEAYTYDVDRYVGLVGGNYRFTDKTSTGFGFQHTQVNGTIRNTFDKFWVDASHEYSEDASLEARLEIFNFNEKTIGYGGYNDFDDYNGFGAEVVYSKKF